MKRIFISFIPQPCSLNDLGVAYKQIGGFPGGSDIRIHLQRETWVQSLGWEDLEKEMETHSILMDRGA